MKRFLGILTLLILLIALVACDSDDENNGPRPTATPREITWQRPSEAITVANAPQLELIGFLGGHTATVDNMAFSADNLRLATSSSGDQLVQVWNLASGRIVRSITDVHVQYLFFSADANTLFTIGRENLLYAWDLLDENQRPEGLSVSANFVTAVAQSPDMTRLAVGNVDGRIVLINLDPLTEHMRTEAHFFPIDHVLFTPDSNTVISMGQEGNIKFWDFETFDEIHTIGQFFPVPQNMALSPDGSLLVVSFLEYFTIYQLNNNYLPLPEIAVPPNSAGASLDFSPDQSKIITTGDNELVHIWDVQTGKLVAGLPNHQRRIAGAIFSNDNQLVLTGSAGPNLFLWNLSAAETIPSIDGGGEQIRVPFAQIAPRDVADLDIFRVLWSSNGQMIAISDTRGPVYVLGIPASGEE